MLLNGSWITRVLIIGGGTNGLGHEEMGAWGCLDEVGQWEHGFEVYICSWHLVVVTMVLLLLMVLMLVMLVVMVIMDGNNDGDDNSYDSNDNC